MNDETTVGDMMTTGRHDALRTLAIGAGILVYLGALLYSGVHNWRLLTSGVSADLVLWAALGVVSLEVSAAALPLALHYWTHDHMQRLAAFAFYGVDLALIMLNVVLDFAGASSGATVDMPPWLQSYLFWIVPMTPIIAGLGWSVLLLLDPAQRERAMIETLRASTRAALAGRIATQARAADVSQEVDQAAATLARDVIRQTLGVTLAHHAPAGVVEARAREVQPTYKPSGNGHKPQVIYQATVEDPNQHGG